MTRRYQFSVQAENAFGERVEGGGEVEGADERDALAKGLAWADGSAKARSLRVVGEGSVTPIKGVWEKLANWVTRCRRP